MKTTVFFTRCYVYRNMHTLTMMQTIFDHAHAPEHITEQHVEVAIHEWKTHRDETTAYQDAKEEAYRNLHANPRTEAERAYQAYLDQLASTRPKGKRPSPASLREWITRMKDLSDPGFAALRDPLYTCTHIHPSLGPVAEAQAEDANEPDPEDTEDEEQKETPLDE